MSLTYDRPYSDSSLSDNVRQVEPIVALLASTNDTCALKILGHLLLLYPCIVVASYLVHMHCYVPPWIAISRSLPTHHSYITFC